MHIKRFYKLVTLTCLFLILLALGLSYFIYHQGPRVRLVKPDESIRSSAYTKDSVITVYFDRPIKQADYSQSVNLEPRADYRVHTNVQSLTISLNESLVHDKVYDLTVEPDIIDKSDIRMRSPHTYKFKTAAPYYMYIDRDTEIGEDSYSENDHLIMGQAGSNSKKTIFSAPSIRMFAANSEYAAVVSANSNNDELIFIDLNNMKTYKPELFTRGIISNIVIRPRGSTILFTTRLSISQAAQQTFVDDLNRLYAYDLETDNFEVIRDSEKNHIRADRLIMSNDGQAVLISDDRSNYFAVSPYNDYDPAPLGYHSQTYGFNENSSEIIFREISGISSYDIIDGILADRKIQDVNSLVSMSFAYGKLFSLNMEFQNGKYDSYLFSQNDWQDKRKLIWKLEGSSSQFAEEFTQSYDNQLLAIRVGSTDCEYDNLEVNSVCNNIKTLIINTDSGDYFAELPGFDLVWLP